MMFHLLFGWQIRDALLSRAKDFHILLDDVAITHLSFSREYTAAIEAKQVAQQDSERAKYVVLQAKQEKVHSISNSIALLCVHNLVIIFGIEMNLVYIYQMSIVLRAQGEATSALLVGKAIKDNPGFLHLRRLDAAKEIAHTVSKSPNKLFLNTDALMLNVNAGEGKLTKCS